MPVGQMPDSALRPLRGCQSAPFQTGDRCATGQVARRVGDVEVSSAGVTQDRSVRM